MRSTIMLFTFLAMQASVWADTSLVFPWLTQNDQFAARVIINNLGAEEATVTLRAVRANGDTQTVERQIGALGQLVETTASMFDELGNGPGYAAFLTSDADDIHGAFIVAGRGSASGDSPAQANVVGADSAANIIIFEYLPIFDNPPASSAPVVVNMGDEAAKVTYHAYQDGAIVASSERNVEPGRPFADVTANLFPGVLGDLYVVAESAQPIIGLAFVFNASLEPAMANASALASVPMGTTSTPGLVSSLPLSTAVPIENLTMDPDGNTYGAEGYFGSRVWKIDPAGNVSTFASGLAGPNSIARDADGNLYVTEFNANRVSKITPAGQTSVLAAVPVGPQAIALGPDNNLYVAQYGTNDNGTIISKVTLAGTVSTLASGGLITVPNGITFDGDGNLYCINTYNRNINRITPEGDVSTFATLPAGGGGFLGGSMVTVNGKIYVTSPDRNVIYQVTEGNVTVFAGSGAPGNADGQGTAATFTRPLGLTTNAAKTKLFSTTYEQANASLRVTEL